MGRGYGWGEAKEVSFTDALSCIRDSDVPGVLQVIDVEAI